MFQQHAFITILLLAILPVPALAEFPDVDSAHLNNTAITYVQERKIVGGYPDGTFRPDSAINRAEFTKIIVGSAFDEIEPCEEQFFPDVPADTWFAPYVCKAKQEGIIDGYPDGTFRPSDPINFVESAKILVEALNVKKEDALTASTIWYKPYVASLLRHDAVPSSINDYAKQITRGEMAEMTYRLLTRSVLYVPDGPPEIRGVAYESDAFTFNGTLCVPSGPGPFPGVLYVHGGDGSHVSGALEETCEALANAGYVGFSPRRRVSISLKGPTEDVLAAVNYVRGLPEVDRDRIALIGFNWGALLSFLATAKTPDVSALVLLAPAPDRGPLDRYAPVASDISAPVLILVAANDNVNTDFVRVSHKIKQTLEVSKKRVELIQYPPFGINGHELFFGVESSYWEDILTFLQYELKQ